MKKIVLFILCMSLCTVSVMPVLAAEEVPKDKIIRMAEINELTNSTNYFSKTIQRLSSINGIASAPVTINSGSISGSTKVTSISFNIQMSSGSDPFILYVQSPDGTIHIIYVTKSGMYVLDDFNGDNPYGSWKIWIVTEGTASIVNITMKVNYSY